MLCVLDGSRSRRSLAGQAAPRGEQGAISTERRRARVLASAAGRAGAGTHARSLPELAAVAGHTGRARPVVDLGTGPGYMLPYPGSGRWDRAGTVIAEDVRSDFLEKARERR